MMHSQCDMDQTRRYLQGRMKADELRAFEEQLKTNAPFREEFEFNKDLLESMHIHYKNRLKDKLRSLDQSSAGKAFPHSGWYYKWAGIAAALLVVAISSYWFFFLRTNTQAIFDQYYTPYYNVLDGAERSVDGDYGNLAMRLYDQERYEEALPVFERAIAQEPDASMLLFYKALAHLSTGQADAAIVHLEKVMAQTDFRLKEPARWYLGLAFLHKGDTAAAKNIFEEIAATHDSYSERAKEILEALH